MLIKSRNMYKWLVSPRAKAQALYRYSGAFFFFNTGCNQLFTIHFYSKLVVLFIKFFLQMALLERNFRHTSYPLDYLVPFFFFLAASAEKKICRRGLFFLMSRQQSYILYTLQNLSIQKWMTIITIINETERNTANSITSYTCKY